MLPSDAIAAEELAALAERGHLREIEALEGPQGPVVALGGRALINFSSNDYLGLAAEPSLAAAAAEACALGTGAGASRLVVGTLAAHMELERALARFERTEAAVLFNSGYCANLGAISTLVGAEDELFSDALNHASLIDGARLSRARVSVYRHADAEHLGELLAASSARRKLVVTDALFSMDGDAAPLPAICRAAARHGAMVLVDEAHATGVFGARGTGLCEALGVEGAVDLRVGTLSKAAGSFGAFAACSEKVAQLLVNRARALVFTTALPPAICAASLAAIELIAREGGRRERLWGHVRHFAGGLRALGLPAEPRSPVFPVVLGPPERALAASRALRARGFLVKPIRPPTVPEGTSRLRFSLSAAHLPEHLDGALAALGEVLRDLRPRQDAA